MVDSFWFFPYDTGYLNHTISCKKIVSFRSCSAICSCCFAVAVRIKKEADMLGISSKNVRSNKFGSKKFLGKKIFWSTGPKKYRSKKFGSKNIWVKWSVIQKYFGRQKLKALEKLDPKSLVKIGSVTAEIFLMWTNIASKNVAWTNITVTVGIC